MPSRTTIGIFALCVLVVFVQNMFAQTPRRQTAQGLDAVFLQLTEQLPGFAGYFFDANGDLNVYLKDVSREGAARGMFASVASNRKERWSQP